MLNCHEVTRLLSEAQERRLSFRERTALKMHTMMCAGCRNYGVHMQTLRHVMHAYAAGADQRNKKADPGESEE